MYYVNPNLPIPPTQSLFSPCCPYICSLYLCLYSCFADKIKGGQLRQHTSAGGCNGAQARLTGATPRPRSGAEVGRTPCLMGGGQEELTHVQGQRPGEATPYLRWGVAAERSCPTSEVRGSGQGCQAATAQEQPRGANPHPRSGVATERSNPTSKEWWLHRQRRA